MQDPSKTIFISYRRNVSSFVARSIFLDLLMHGYHVFMDVENIDSGTFDTIILNQIASRTHFLLVLTPGTLERCNEEGDWLRREIEWALDLERNIVPIFANGFVLDASAKSYLTGKLANLARYNGMELPHNFFDAAMERLRERFLKDPTSGPARPVPPREQVIVERKIEMIVSQPAPTRTELKAEDFFLQGVQELERGNFYAAIQQFAKAIELNTQYVEAYHHRGKAYAANQNLDEALNDLTHAVRLNPQYADAYASRGQMLYDKQEFRSAIADYTSAIELSSPDKHRYYVSRGMARLRLGAILEAYGDFNEALRLNPRYAPAYGSRGLALAEEEKFEQAIQEFTQAIALNRQAPDYYVERGLVYYQSGKYRQAIEDYDEAIRLNNAHVDVYLHRGLAHHALNELRYAILDYTSAIHLDPQNAVAYNNRGVAYKLKGELDRALADFEMALEIDPLYKKARTNRDQVLRHLRGC